MFTFIFLQVFIFKNLLKGEKNILIKSFAYVIYIEINSTTKINKKINKRINYYMQILKLIPSVIINS